MVAKAVHWLKDKRRDVGGELMAKAEDPQFKGVYGRLSLKVPSTNVHTVISKIGDCSHAMPYHAMIRRRL